MIGNVENAKNRSVREMMKMDATCGGNGMSWERCRLASKLLVAPSQPMETESTVPPVAQRLKWRRETLGLSAQFVLAGRILLYAGCQALTRAKNPENLKFLKKIRAKLKIPWKGGVKWK